MLSFSATASAKSPEPLDAMILTSRCQHSLRLLWDIGDITEAVPDRSQACRSNMLWTYTHQKFQLDFVFD